MRVGVDLGSLLYVECLAFFNICGLKFNELRFLPVQRRFSQVDEHRGNVRSPLYRNETR